MRFFKILLGLIFCVLGFGWFVAAIVLKQSPWIIGTLVCIVFAVFLFRSAKKAKGKQTLKREMKTIKHYAKNPKALAKDLAKSAAFTVETTTDFPVYPNQDTDIPADAYIYGENGIRRADGKPINDADAAYLIRAGAERAREEVRMASKSMSRRQEKEEELLFQFFYNYGDKSAEMCDVFHDLADEAFHAKTAEERLALLQQCADAFEKAKNWHYNHSKGGKLWFQDMYEHQHNSKNECFSWIDSVLENIQDTQKEIDIIIPWILEHAKEGFLQTEIYKAFPEDSKASLRKTIDSLDDQGKLHKEKKGSSYFITDGSVS